MPSYHGYIDVIVIASVIACDDHHESNLNLISKQDQSQ